MKIDAITIGADRQRKDIGELEGLAGSIKRVGLIHPIIVDEDNILISGERRLRACRLLGWEEIDTKQRKDLSDSEKREIELEENIRRKALSWQEEVSAKAELDAMQREEFGDAYGGQGDIGWKVKDTATMLGESVGTVSMDIQLANAIKQFPQLKDEPNKAQAMNKYTRLLDKMVREVLVEEKDKKEVSSKSYEVFCGDCCEELGRIPPNSIDCIITDPPFGVGLDKAFDFKKKYDEAYVFEDTKEHWNELLGKVMPELYRVLKDDGHMYIFFPSKHIEEMIYQLNHVKFDFDPIPNIWIKGASAGTVYQPHQRFRPNYEPFFFCWKSNPRPLAYSRGAVFDFPGIAGQTKKHPAEKPSSLARELCLLSTVEGETILDPFAGVGSLLKTCLKLKRKVIGIELDPKYYNIIVEDFKNEETSREEWTNCPS